MNRKTILVLMMYACAPFFLQAQEFAKEAEKEDVMAQVDSAKEEVSAQENAPKEEPQKSDEAEVAEQEEPEIADAAEDALEEVEQEMQSAQEDDQDQESPAQDNQSQDGGTPKDGLASVDMDNIEFDVNERRGDAAQLVNRGVQAFKEKSLEEACSAFSHTKEFIDGDLYLFVYDMRGVCLAHGEDPTIIWKNLMELKDWVGTPVIKEILRKAKDGGGWVTYGWNNATKVSLIQPVEKDGKAYAIGCGYYPQSKEEAVVNLVRGGVSLFKQIKKDGDPVDWAFSRMSYPRGRFIAGNLYLYALDFKGNIVSQGERPGLIGSNSWDYKDANGKYVNREIVNKLKNSNQGIWIEYTSKRAPKKAYAEKVKDRDGNEYFIACGYYPTADRDAVVNLVRKGYQFMKTAGKSSAVEEFSQRRDDRFRYGDLDLTVYSLKGKILASGSNPDSIGINKMDTLDEDGVAYVKEIITRANKEGIWVNARIKGSFQSTYAQKIDLGVDSFVIACSYYPVSKPETMMLLVQSAASYLKTNSREEAFGQFSDQKGMFRRGDLELYVIDATGLCYVWGDDVNLIWRNIMKLKDEDGRPFIKLFINETKGGPNVVKTRFNGAVKTNYLVPVNKDGKTYIVGSGFYQ